jgi:Zn-dependent peptidase ImmA (M78 family)
MFTLGHELAHIWLGAAGLSGFEGLFPPATDVEEWCNEAAAEFLVPAQELRARWADVRRTTSPFEELARVFKVSPIVAARRGLDLRLISRKASLPSTTTTRNKSAAEGRPSAEATSTATKIRAWASCSRATSPARPWRGASVSRRLTTSPD